MGGGAGARKRRGYNLLLFEIKEYNESCQKKALQGFPYFPFPSPPQRLMDGQPKGVGERVGRGYTTRPDGEHLALTALPRTFPQNLALMKIAGILFPPFQLYDPWDRKKDPQVMLTELILQYLHLS